MPSDPLLVGIDVGTTNIKALIFDAQGHEVAQSQTKTPTHYPQADWAYYEPEELWLSVVNVLKKAIAQTQTPNNIVGVAVASIGETGIPIDTHGKPTYHAIAWFDQRTRPQYQYLCDRFDSDEIFSQTGVSPQPIFGLCKILWLRDNEPDAFTQTTTWLNTADYIAYKLSGVPATDYSLASRTLAFDLHTRQWAKSILNAVDISPNLFAQLCAGGTDLGAVLPEIAQQTGLPPHTRICTGGHDHICGALAAGATQPGTLLNSLGTAEALCFPISDPLTDPEIGRQNFTLGAHVVPNRDYFLGGLLTSGACIEWFRNLFGPQTEYTTLIAEAKKAAPGSLGVAFSPQMRFPNPPHKETISRGAFVGLTPDVDRGTLFRSILEGLAFEMRHVIDGAQSHEGVPQIEHIIAIGGGIRNHLLMQVKATVLNHPIATTTVDEATALGAAILAGLGAGVYPDVDTALTTIDLPKQLIHPISNQIADYNTIYHEVYEQMYPSVQDLHHRVDQIQQRKD